MLKKSINNKTYKNYVDKIDRIAKLVNLDCRVVNATSNIV